MTAAEPNVKDIFSKALDIESAAERAEFLGNACASNPVLRAEVEDLLSAAASAGSFMKGPVCGVEPTLDHPTKLEQPGQMI